MNTHAAKTQENKSQSVSAVDSQMQSGGESTFQFVDNRPEAIAQRKMQEMVNNSSQVSQLRAFQNMANNSPQAIQSTQLQAMANTFSAQLQQPILKKASPESGRRMVQQKQSQGERELETIQRKIRYKDENIKIRTPEDSFDRDHGWEEEVTDEATAKKTKERGQVSTLVNDAALATSISKSLGEITMKKSDHQVKFPIDPGGAKIGRPPTENIKKYRVRDVSSFELTASWIDKKKWWNLSHLVESEQAEEMRTVTDPDLVAKTAKAKAAYDVAEKQKILTEEAAVQADKDWRRIRKENRHAKKAADSETMKRLQKKTEAAKKASDEAVEQKNLAIAEAEKAKTEYDEKLKAEGI
jgi:hypothetical protein